MRIVTTNPNIIPIQTHLEELEARLHHGDRIIRQLEAEQKPVEHLVEYWLTLLHEYEEAFRAEQTAA